MKRSYSPRQFWALLPAHRAEAARWHDAQSASYHGTQYVYEEPQNL